MGGRGSALYNGGKSRKTSIKDRENPETLEDAIGDKEQSHTISESMLNANFLNYNPYKAEYSENCQRCVVAYELQRRGYDVEARPTFEGDTLAHVTHTHTEVDMSELTSQTAMWARWMGSFQHARPIAIGGYSYKQDSFASTEDVINNLERKMRAFGDGSRGVVQVSWKDVNYGHVFNVENEGGRIWCIDAQTGEKLDIRATMKRVDTNNVTLVRTDNLRISERAKKAVRRRKD